MLRETNLGNFSIANNSVPVLNLGPTVAYSSVIRDVNDNYFTALLLQRIREITKPLPQPEIIHLGPDNTTEYRNYYPSLSNPGIAFLVTDAMTLTGKEIRGTGDVVILNTVAADGSEFSNLGRPFINDPNLIAFGGINTKLGDGLFTVPGSPLNPASTEVVIVGDQLFGETITSLALGGFNDAGRLAFWASTKSGAELVVLATPMCAKPACG
jgi:hypothetical protein